jgi:hypothetical protein
VIVVYSAVGILLMLSAMLSVVSLIAEPEQA